MGVVKSTQQVRSAGNHKGARHRAFRAKQYLRFHNGVSLGVRWPQRRAQCYHIGFMALSFEIKTSPVGRLKNDHHIELEAALVVLTGSASPRAARNAALRWALCVV
jgi:hypothetical protein